MAGFLHLEIILIMRINKSETEVLFNGKIAEGKDSFKANEEIKRDKDFLLGLTITKREKDVLTRKLERAYNHIESLKVLLKKRSAENMNKRLVENLKNYQSNHPELATTRELTRVMAYINEYGKTGYSELHKLCGFVNAKAFQNGISFLLKEGLLTQIQEGRRISIIKNEQGIGAVNPNQEQVISNI